MFETIIIQPIFNLLIALYSIIPGGDFGVAIILFTIFVRFILYPLQRSMLHQTRTMHKLQPQLARIKKQAKGNRQLESMRMMELYKKHNVNPFRSIGILLIQLPIFIALYHVIQVFTVHRDAIERLTYSFLEGLEPVRQLIEHPEQFNEHLFTVVDLTKSAFHNGTFEPFLIILALVAAGTQYIMSRQTMPQRGPKRRLRDIMAEAAEGKQADQAEINASVMGMMTKFLPILMFFIMISLPGALALYYAVSNIVAVGQQAYLLKQDEEELEEIADEVRTKPAKKATAKAKARQEKATEATVVRIKASQNKRRK